MESRESAEFGQWLSIINALIAGQLQAEKIDESCYMIKQGTETVTINGTKVTVELPAEITQVLLQPDGTFQEVTVSVFNPSTKMREPRPKHIKTLEVFIAHEPGVAFEQIQEQAQLRMQKEWEILQHYVVSNTNATTATPPPAPPTE